MSLRLKLLVAASLMLVFPIAGYRYVRGMEEFLRQDQSRAVLATARALATALQTRVELFREPTPFSENSTELHIQPLPYAPVIDGYDQEWESLALPHTLTSDQLTIGRYRQHLYLLLGVPDPMVRFTGIHGSGQPQGDFLKLTLTDGTGYERSWILAAQAPGPLQLDEITPPRGQIVAAYPDHRLHGAVQLHPGGYVVELQFPIALMGTHLSLEINDHQSGVRLLPASGNYEVRLPSRAIRSLLENLGHRPGQRIWVTDRHRRVLARSGRADTTTQEDIPALLRLLLPEIETDPLDLRSPDHRLTGPELDSALADSPASRWRLHAEQGQYRLSAAYPVRSNTGVIGAVVVEHSTQEILILRLKALAELLISSLLSFALAVGGLLLIASSMVGRLRRLRQTAADAIDSHGRIRGPFVPPDGSDEISDLGHSFAVLFSRLGQYNQYLEQLARRLSHELRTPLAIIRSSLDNLAMSRTEADPSDIYQQRALEGVERLETILKRMTEAARLEQALAATEMERIDAVNLTAAAIAAHQQAWPEFPIDAQLPKAELQIKAAPDLLLQALDKLLANARDFSNQGRPITVGLSAQNGQATFWVENYGPVLPDENFEHLFDSMVSHRSSSAANQNEPHLGLGLYVVRLVAECHDGMPFAVNLASGEGVRLGFSVRI